MITVLKNNEELYACFIVMGFLQNTFWNGKKQMRIKSTYFIHNVFFLTDPMILGKGASLYSIWVTHLCVLFTSILSFCLYSHHEAITLLFANFDFSMIGNIYTVIVHVYGCFSYLKDS